MKVLRALVLLLLSFCVLMTSTACQFLSFGKGSEETSEAESSEAEAVPYEYVIVRSQSASNDLRDLSVFLRDFLRDQYDTKVTLKTDATSYAPEDSQIWIILGATDYELSKTAKDQWESGKISYCSDGNSIAIYAETVELIKFGLENYAYHCMNDEKLIPSDDYRSATMDVSAFVRDDWKLLFPAYVGGKLNETVYSAGYGLSQSSNQSSMQVVEETTADEYHSYLQLLNQYGYILEFSNEIDGNLFASCRGKLGSNIYVYFMKNIGKVRIIHDTVSPSLEDFCYQTETSSNTAFYTFRLSSGSEDTLLIHAADNSWIMLDGGVTEYADIDPQGTLTDDLYNFMVERSNLKNGEKLTISGWYLSHAHRDHFLAMTSFIKKYHSQIDLQRVIANVPDTKVVTDGNYTQYKECLATIEQFFPNVMWMKAHTGMIIQLADVSFEILYAQEDMIEEWCASHKLLPNKVYDFNNSSLLSKVTVGDFTVLELGDGFRCDDLLNQHYSYDTIACDVIKMSHHGINIDPNEFYNKLYNTGKIKYAIVTSPTNGKQYDIYDELEDCIINSSTSYAFEFSLNSNREIVVEKILIQ